ncbi:MAG: oligosaccharide flippase family protein, partial [Candidatus Methanomethylophilaceae archaeon]|nr:oligosaccharide flippase family protein [Candidatus Methanomethylophilaceae archaeon]
MLARNFTFKVTSQLLAAIMAFVSMLVMTRYVANEYGVMMWGLALISLVNTIADLGFNSANLKFIAKEGYDKQACFSTFMVIKLILTALMVIITLATVFIMRATDSINDEAVGVCMVFIVYQVISNVQFAIYYTLDGMMKSGKSSILTIIECGIRNTILIALAVTYVDPITLSTAYVIATSISVIVSIILIWREGMRPVRPKYLREYMVFAAPLAAALILTSAVSNLDKVIVGLFYESIEVTYYSTAVGTIATFTAIGVSMNTVLLPHLSKNVEDSAHTEKTLWGLERLMCTILLPLVAFFMILGPQIAAVLFGSAMTPS